MKTVLCQKGGTLPFKGYFSRFLRKFDLKTCITPPKYRNLVNLLLSVIGEDEDGEDILAVF